MIFYFILGIFLIIMILNPLFVAIYYSFKIFKIEKKDKEKIIKSFKKGKYKTLSDDELLNKLGEIEESINKFVYLILFMVFGFLFILLPLLYLFFITLKQLFYGLAFLLIGYVFAVVSLYLIFLERKISIKLLSEKIGRY